MTMICELKPSAFSVRYLLVWVLCYFRNVTLEFFSKHTNDNN